VRHAVADEAVDVGAGHDRQRSTAVRATWRLDKPVPGAKHAEPSIIGGAMYLTINETENA
jgi:hypothetical protein